MSIFKAPLTLNAVDALITRMRKIVSTMIPKEKFRKDFEINDRYTLQHCEGAGVFAWYVYDCGTHLIPLNNIEEVRSFQREWLDGMKQIEGKKPGMVDALYVLNVWTGDFRRVYDFRSCGDLSDRLLKSVS
ncbi:hypothetical protein [Paenibacillus gansuensis]|uniref:Phage protein n=1 Tax=Paenibacillus gansuensis TaxID=306542 RepID=A0ABW5PID5_9BACL